MNNAHSSLENVFLTFSNIPAFSCNKLTTDLYNNKMERTTEFDSAEKKKQKI